MKKFPKKNAAKIALFAGATALMALTPASARNRRMIY